MQSVRRSVTSVQVSERASFPTTSFARADTVVIDGSLIEASSSIFSSGSAHESDPPSAASGTASASAAAGSDRRRRRDRGLQQPAFEELGHHVFKAVERCLPVRRGQLHRSDRHALLEQPVPHHSPLQDKYSASMVQASTSGPRLEMLRVDSAAGTGCVRCFNRPHTTTSDAAVRASAADMDEAATIAAHLPPSAPVPTKSACGGRTGGCDQIGDALMGRLRPSGGDAAHFSVGFRSVLAGIQLAAQVVKDAARRSGRIRDSAENTPLVGSDARLVTNMLDPSNAAAGVRRYRRGSERPACRGVRRAARARRSRTALRDGRPLRAAAFRPPSATAGASPCASGRPLQGRLRSPPRRACRASACRSAGRRT